MPLTSGGSSSSSSAPAPDPANRNSDPTLIQLGTDDPPTAGRDDLGAEPPGTSTEIQVDISAGNCCDCGKEVDELFIDKLLQALSIKDDVHQKCRECKALRLLEECVEVDKYSYNGWLVKRKRKLLRLSKDHREVQLWQKHSASRVQMVPVNEILGVVFGAYTCTFKKQRSVDMPPHWAAFSLVGRTRTYDFSARDPEVVECCVRMLQRVVWDRRSPYCRPGRAGSAAEGGPGQDASSLREPAASDFGESASASLPSANASVSSTGSSPPCPDLGAFEPWPLGFFLWMRLRFRLQEEAQKKSLGPDHMLWTVFMRCAFLSSDEVSKARFIDMAEKLQQENNFSDLSGAEMRELSLKIRFQKEREMDIVKDRYECHIETFLPRAPRAVVRRRLTHQSVTQSDQHSDARYSRKQTL